LENRKTKNFEMFMCTNELGHVDYIKYYKLHQYIGIVPEEPYCLMMSHALQDMGVLKYEMSADELLENQKKRRPAPRIRQVVRADHGRAQRLKQLTSSCNLHESMGELLLTELKLDVSGKNKHLEMRARLLGLMEW